MHRRGNNNGQAYERQTSKSRKFAIKRITRDLLEWERADIKSIAAVPMPSDILEWHVNIRPSDGVYSGVHFHLIMTFPVLYPHQPPTIFVCTPIEHPNIFDSYLCLSMLKSEYNEYAYEGWSSAYSITSILMQLQSFLFAEKIDQESGYATNAQLSDRNVVTSINTCKSFVCKHQECKHSHKKPFPEVSTQETIICVKPLDLHVEVQGSACQTTHTYWVGAYGDFAIKSGRVMYEAYVNWTGDKWSRTNIRGGLCRFGWGTENAFVCGHDSESFGYGGTGMYSFSGQFDRFGESFTKGDTITCAVDFEAERPRVYFAKNGVVLEPFAPLYLPRALCGQFLYPILSFKNSRAEFNFGSLRKGCHFLIDNGFQTLEEFRASCLQRVMEGQNNNNNSNNSNGNNHCDNNKNGQRSIWLSGPMIEDFWISILCGLTVPDIYRCRFVCQRWCAVIEEFNLMQRNSLCCFFSKLRPITRPHAEAHVYRDHNEVGQYVNEKTNTGVLGIGLQVIVTETAHGRSSVSIESQMDVLSVDAWERIQVRRGVWGETLTHFLPLVINNCHAKSADREIMKRLRILSSTLAAADMNGKNGQNGRKRAVSFLVEKVNNNAILRAFDTVVRIMNTIVVQFVMTNANVNASANNAQTPARTARMRASAIGARRAARDIHAQKSASVSMQFCEKVLLGYCTFYHLLLYLQQKYRGVVQPFCNCVVRTFIDKQQRNGRLKNTTPDLGKFLIYTLMSSEYSWSDIAELFIYEVNVRNVRWYVQKHAVLNSTSQIRSSSSSNQNRLHLTFMATSTSRSLVMFQVWFMQNVQSSLRGYNRRLGQPPRFMAKLLKTQTATIIACKNWKEYFEALQVRFMTSQHQQMDFNQTMDQLLRWSVYESSRVRYHWPPQNAGARFQSLNPPRIVYAGDHNNTNNADARFNHNRKNIQMNNNNFGMARYTIAMANRSHNNNNNNVMNNNNNNNNREGGHNNGNQVMFRSSSVAQPNANPNTYNNSNSNSNNNANNNANNNRNHNRNMNANMNVDADMHMNQSRANKRNNGNGNGNGNRSDNPGNHGMASQARTRMQIPSDMDEGQRRPMNNQRQRGEEQQRPQSQRPIQPGSGGHFDNNTNNNNNGNINNGHNGNNTNNSNNSSSQNTGQTQKPLSKSQKRKLRRKRLKQQMAEQN